MSYDLHYLYRFLSLFFIQRIRTLGDPYSGRIRRGGRRASFTEALQKTLCLPLSSCFVPRFFCALAASVCVSYAFAEKLERALPDTVSFLALPIVICVSALVILCFGVYIPAAAAGNAASFVPAQQAADGV